MRLKTTLAKQAKHSELVSSVAWASADEVFSAADDHQILRWNLANGETSRVAELPEGVYPTDVHWFPKSGGAGPGGGGAKKMPGSDIFVLAATDGRFHLIGKAGRIEKSVEGHRGAVLSARWSFDGAALATSGEDGQVKIWSRSGMLRSTLSQNSVPVYCVSWGPDSDSVLCTLGKQLVIKSMQANAKALVWKAHEGVILKADWNPVNGLIVSGGEDCRYKVWDSYGRIMFISSTHDYPITSVAWAPDGELFAVGGYNTLRLCDKCGWSYSLEKPNTGSLFNLAWSSDSTQLAGATGNGHVIFGHVTELRLAWRHLEAVVSEERSVGVRNVTDGSTEKLDFRDRVVKVSLGFGHLIVVTSSQCYVYNTKNWNTPTIFELKEGCVTLVVQCERLFLLADGPGLYVYSYEGRLVCTPRHQGMRTDLLHAGTCSLTPDTIAVRDKSDEKVIFLFDASTGKPLGDGKPIVHKMEVSDIALDQVGPAPERKLAVVDKNRDLYLMTLRVYGTARKTIKIATMIMSMQWSDSASLLAAIGNGKLMVWYYPNAAFVDRDLLQRTVYERDASEFGKDPALVSFHGNHLTMRRAEGSQVTCGVSALPSVLASFVAKNKWADALRLCRFVKDETLWACLAAMATSAKDLNTSEVAYAAINEADKVQYIQYIKQLPLKEARNAEMLLMSGNFQDAEGVLLQSGLIFRAIMLNITLYNWERALELAVKHKTNVDTVLAYREKYLQTMGRSETSKQFIQYADTVEVDWEQILAKIDQEYQNERERPVEAAPSRPSTHSNRPTAGGSARLQKPVA